MCSACGVPSFCPWRRPEAESGQDSSRILTLIHEYRHYFVKNAAGAKLEGFRGKTRGYPFEPGFEPRFQLVLAPFFDLPPVRP